MLMKCTLLSLCLCRKIFCLHLCLRFLIFICFLSCALRRGGVTKVSNYYYWEWLRQIKCGFKCTVRITSIWSGFACYSLPLLLFASYSSSRLSSGWFIHCSSYKLNGFKAFFWNCKRMESKIDFNRSGGAENISKWFFVRSIGIKSIQNVSWKSKIFQRILSYFKWFFPGTF